jgi:hypothetical protein
LVSKNSLSAGMTTRFLVEAKNFSVGMTMVNWWLSDPLFVAGCIEARLR